MAGSLRVVKEGAIAASIAAAVAAQKGIADGIAPLGPDREVPALHSRVKSVFGRTGDVGIQAGEAGEIRSIDGVSNPGGNVDLVPSGAIVLIPDDAANSIGISESLGTAAGLQRVGNLLSIATDGVVGSMVSPAIKDALPATQSLRSLGTGAQQALPGNDPRLHERNHNLFSTDHPDVDAADVPASGEVLTFDGAVGKWRAAPSAGSGGAAPQTHIGGLNLEWVSGSSLRLTSGEAYVPALNGLLEVPNPITLSALSLVASVWYFAYLFRDAAGAPALELVTQAPNVPYRGFARVKGGATPDSTRRYLGAVRTSGAGAMWMFHRSDSGLILWKENLDQSPFLLLNNAATGTTTAVQSAAAIVPPTARTAYMRVFLSTASRAMIGSPDDQSGTGTVHDVRPGQYIPIFAALDPSQQFYHRASAAGNIFAAALGYVEEGR